MVWKVLFLRWYFRIEIGRTLEWLKRHNITLRMLPYLAIGWVITNGWSYIGAYLGVRLKLRWLSGISLAYMSFLYFPFTAEKVVTVAIAFGLYKWTHHIRRKDYEKYMYSWGGRIHQKRR